MSTRKAKRTPPAEIRRLAARIDEWRRSRARRTAAMPAELWSAATALAERHGVYRVARALRVNFETLRWRVADARTRTATPSSGFVELTGAALGTIAPAPSVEVELSDGRGARLVVRCSAPAPLDVAAIVAAFRRGGA